MSAPDNAPTSYLSQTAMADKRLFAPGQRVLARKIYADGKLYELHTAQLAPDGTLQLAPFVAETASTTYFDAPIEVNVEPTPAGPRLAVSMLAGVSR